MLHYEFQVTRLPLMRTPWPLLLLSGTLLSASPAYAELNLASVRTHQAAQTVLLDLELEIDDPASDIPRALLRGEVWLDVEITLVEKLRMFTNQQVGRIHVLQRLSYDPRNNIYQITRVNQQEQQDFTSLALALTRLQVLNALPVTRLDWLLPELDRYQGEVRVHLYANPMPMAPDIGSARSRPLDWQSQVIQWRLP